jgi:site-specific recombinase XerD
MMIGERREVVERFLERCIIYSNASIERKEARNDNLEDINKWKAYRDFMQITVKEIRAKELDTWLEDGPVSYEPGTEK